MILAGDIGATRTRLAAFQTEGNRLNCVVQKIYPSQEHNGLLEVLREFSRTEGIPGRQEQDFEFALDHRLQGIGCAAEAQFRGPAERS